MRSSERTGNDPFRAANIAVATHFYPIENTIRNTIVALKRFRPVIFYEREKANRFLGKELPLPSGIRRHLVTEGHRSVPPFHDLFFQLGKCGTCLDLFKSEGIRLIHAQFASIGASYLALARALGIPLISHCRGQDIYELPKNPYHYIRLKHLFVHGELFLTTSDRMRKHMITALGCPDDKVMAFYTGVDLGRFKFDPGIADGTGCSILMCGRLIEKKGFEDGIKIFSGILKDFPKATLKIAGEGPLKQKLIDISIRSGIVDKVSFPGFLSQDEVASEMSGSCVLLMPYRTSKSGDSEGLPNVIKEALARGLPVATTRHAGVDEVIADGENGLLVDEGDSDGLAGKLAMLLGDNSLRRALAHNGRGSAERLFDIEKCASSLEDVYENVIDNYRAKHYH
jgi:colanic acid/amylovoran biosynthesis glycosyltransferase